MNAIRHLMTEPSGVAALDLELGSTSMPTIIDRSVATPAVTY
jgi:hypothetical protein